MAACEYLLGSFSVLPNTCHTWRTVLFSNGVFCHHEIFVRISTNIVEISDRCPYSHHDDRCFVNRVCSREGKQLSVCTCLEWILASANTCLCQVWNASSKATVDHRRKHSTCFNGIYLLRVQFREHLHSRLRFISRLGLSNLVGNFVRVTADTVAYETRKWRILEQILMRQPDLCALEEVDIYDCFLRHQLPKYGYLWWAIVSVCLHCYVTLFEDTHASVRRNWILPASISKTMPTISKVPTVFFSVTKLRCSTKFIVITVSILSKVVSGIM